jgi:hypothetical protein
VAAGGGGLRATPQSGGPCGNPNFSQGWPRGHPKKPRVAGATFGSVSRATIFLSFLFLLNILVLIFFINKFKPN